MTESTNDLIKRLESLEKKATKGPWKNEEGGGDGNGSDEVRSQAFKKPSLEYDGHICYAGQWVNAEFIAEARNALPRLLEEVRRLMHIIKNAKRIEPNRSGNTNKSVKFVMNYMDIQDQLESKSTALRECLEGLKELCCAYKNEMWSYAQPENEDIDCDDVADAQAKTHNACEQAKQLLDKYKEKP